MSDFIDDDLLDLIVVSGTPSAVGAQIAERNSFADRTTMMFYGPTPTNDAIAEAVAAANGA